MNGFIIHGGRDNNYQHQFYNDVWFFNMEKEFWQEIKISVMDEIPRRAGHCLEIYNDNLIIFGGFNNDGYLSTYVHMVSLVEKSKSKRDKDMFRIGLIPHPEMQDTPNNMAQFHQMNSNNFNED